MRNRPLLSPAQYFAAHQGAEQRLPCVGYALNLKILGFPPTVSCVFTGLESELYTFDPDEPDLLLSASTVRTRCCASLSGTGLTARKEPGKDIKSKQPAPADLNKAVA